MKMMDIFYSNAIFYTMVLAWFGSFLSVLAKLSFKNNNQFKPKYDFLTIFARFTFLVFIICLKTETDSGEIVIESGFLLSLIYCVRVFYIAYVLICILKWYYDSDLILIFSTGIIMLILHIIFLDFLCSYLISHYKQILL
jgi:hypothetical protein